MTPFRERVVEEMVAWRDPRRAARSLGVPALEVLVELKRPEVRDAILDRFRGNHMSAEEALSDLSDVARGAWGDYLTAPEGGEASFDLPRMVAEGRGRLVQTMTPSAHGVALRFPDRMAALKLVLEGHGMLSDGASPEDIKALVERYRRVGGQAAEARAALDPKAVPWPVGE